METTKSQKTSNRTQSLKSLAICDPSNAVNRAVQFGATLDEIKMLKAFIQKLNGKTARYL